MKNRFFIGETMKSLFLFFKGILIGLGKVIPGVSGSFLAILLHVYEESILAFNHFFENVYQNFSFLFWLGSGIGISILFFSRILLAFWNHFPIMMMMFFLGLFLGTIPAYQKNISFSSKFHYLLFLLPFFFSLFLSIFHFSLTVDSFFSFFLLGGLDAFSMIVPGVSGTALFFMLGCYTSLLSLLSHPFLYFSSFLFYLLGMILGAIVVIRLMEYVLKRFSKSFSIFLFGLLWSTVFSFFYQMVIRFSFLSLIVHVPILLLGFFLSFLLGKKSSAKT